MRAFQACLNWIERHRRHFALPPGPIRSTTVLRLKAIGELALTAGIIAGGTRSATPLHGRAQRLLRFAWTQLRAGDLLIDVLQARPDLVVAGSIYPVFARWGLQNQRLNQLLSAMALWQGIRAIEFPPWRALDLALAFVDLRLSASWSRKDLFPKTWLAAEPEPWLLSEDAAYSVTHTVFYMTGFGSRPRGLSTRTRRYLWRWAPAWLIHFQHIRNHDLYAEMAFALACTGARHLTRDVEKTLVAAQRPNGSVPGPLGSGSSLMELARTRSERRFFHDYHTTLVSMLASFSLGFTLDRNHRSAATNGAGHEEQAQYGRGGRRGVSPSL